MAVEDLHSALISNGEGYVKHSEQKSFLVSLAKWVLKSAMWLIFVVWIALFSIVATGFGVTYYSDWVGATDGTLFGETGENPEFNLWSHSFRFLADKLEFSGSLMLLFCPPLMAIAFLAVPYIIFRGQDEEQLQQYVQGFCLFYFHCIAHHLFVKMTNSSTCTTTRKETKKAKYSLWTFPVLVEGPLGVVSAAEMIGIILFIVFVLSAIYFDTSADFVILGAYGDSLTEEEEKWCNAFLYNWKY